MTGTTRPDGASLDETFWERAARTRWGLYLTDHERKALQFASSAAGDATVAVEVGCEGGRWSMLLHEEGWSVICTDVDEAALAVCQERIPAARCLLTEPSEPWARLESGLARLLVVYEVAPVSQRADFAAEAARVLSSGGLLACTYYNPASLRGLAYRALRRLEAARKHEELPRFHSDYYSGASYASFRKGLRLHGFHVLLQIGLSWFPFTRQSDSRLIPACTTLEGLLGLRRLPSLSPLTVVVARKT